MSETLKSWIKTILILILSALLGLALFKYNLSTENILMIYVLSIIIIVVDTKRYSCGIAAVIFFILDFNFFFIEPYYSFMQTDVNSIISLAIFIVISLSVGWLAINLENEKQRSEIRRKRYKKLQDISFGFFNVFGEDKILKYADKRLTELVDADVHIYYKDECEENPAALWTYQNSSKCGHGQLDYQDETNLYIPFRSSTKTIGAVSIDCTNKDLTPSQLNSINVVLSNVALALERDAKEGENQTE